MISGYRGIAAEPGNGSVLERTWAHKRTVRGEKGGKTRVRQPVDRDEQRRERRGRRYVVLLFLRITRSNYKEFSDRLLKTIGIKCGGDQNHKRKIQRIKRRQIRTTRNADEERFRDYKGGKSEPSEIRQIKARRRPSCNQIRKVWLLGVPA